MARRKGGQRGASRLKEKETAALDYTRRLKLSVASAPRDISTTRRLAAGEGAAGARYRWKERRPANTGMADRQWSLLQLPRGTSQRGASMIAQAQAERQGGQEGAAGACGLSRPPKMRQAQLPPRGVPMQTEWTLVNGGNSALVADRSGA